MIRVTADIILADGELEERFMRSSGPGGQNAKIVCPIKLLQIGN